jgi:hypothetical protein
MPDLKSFETGRSFLVDEKVTATAKRSGCGGDCQAAAFIVSSISLVTFNLPQVMNMIALIAPISSDRYILIVFRIVGYLSIIVICGGIIAMYVKSIVGITLYTISYCIMSTGMTIVMTLALVTQLTMFVSDKKETNGGVEEQLMHGNRTVFNLVAISFYILSSFVFCGVIVRFFVVFRNKAENVVAVSD